MYFKYNGSHVFRYSCSVFKPFACWYALASEGYMSVKAADLNVHKKEYN